MTHKKLRAIALVILLAALAIGFALNHASARGSHNSMPSRLHSSSASASHSGASHKARH